MRKIINRKLSMPRWFGQKPSVRTGAPISLKPEMFVPETGKISAHLFENPLTGVKRDLYWSLKFRFQPFEYEEEKEEAGLLVDWLTFDNPLDVFRSKMEVTSKRNPDGEVSCYFQGTHLSAAQWKFEFAPIPQIRKWTLNYDLMVDFWTVEETGDTNLRLSGSTVLEFDGFYIVKDNFSPKVSNAQDAMDLLSQHITLDPELQCEDRGFKFVIK